LESHKAARDAGVAFPDPFVKVEVAPVVAAPVKGGKAPPAGKAPAAAPVPAAPPAPTPAPPAVGPDGKKLKKAPPPPAIPAAAAEALLCLRAVMSELGCPAGPFEVHYPHLLTRSQEVVAAYHTHHDGSKPEVSQRCAFGGLLLSTVSTRSHPRFCSGCCFVFSRRAALCSVTPPPPPFSRPLPPVTPQWTRLRWARVRGTVGTLPLSHPRSPPVTAPMLGGMGSCGLCWV
jgi:hypothetical protein